MNIKEEMTNIVQTMSQALQETKNLNRKMQIVNTAADQLDQLSNRVTELTVNQIAVIKDLALTIRNNTNNLTQFNNFNIQSVTDFGNINNTELNNNDLINELKNDSSDYSIQSPNIHEHIRINKELKDLQISKVYSSMADVTEQHGMFAALQVQQLSKDINALNKTLDKDLDVRNVEQLNGCISNIIDTINSSKKIEKSIDITKLADFQKFLDEVKTDILSKLQNDGQLENALQIKLNFALKMFDNLGNEIAGLSDKVFDSVLNQIDEINLNINQFISNELQKKYSKSNVAGYTSLLAYDNIDPNNIMNAMSRSITADDIIKSISEYSNKIFAFGSDNQNASLALKNIGNTLLLASDADRSIASQAIGNNKKPLFFITEKNKKNVKQVQEARKLIDTKLKNIQIIKAQVAMMKGNDPDLKKLFNKLNQEEKLLQKLQKTMQKQEKSLTTVYQDIKKAKKEIQNAFRTGIIGNVLGITGVTYISRLVTDNISIVKLVTEVFSAYKLIGSNLYKNSLLSSRMGVSASRNYGKLLTEQGMALYALSGGKISKELPMNIYEAMVNRVRSPLTSASRSEDLAVFEMQLMPIIAGFNIPPDTLISFLGTFYSDANASAEEAAQRMGSMIKYAQQSNVPINELLTKLSRLGKVTRDIGVRADKAVGTVKALHQKGQKLLLDDAIQVYQELLNTMSKSAQSGYGVIYGAGTNALNSLAMGMLTHDENGDPNDMSYFQRTSALMGELGQMRMMMGTGPDAQAHLAMSLAKYGVSGKTQSLVKDYFARDDLDGLMDVLLEEDSLNEQDLHEVTNDVVDAIDESRTQLAITTQFAIDAETSMDELALETYDASQNTLAEIRPYAEAYIDWMSETFRWVVEKIGEIFEDREVIDFMIYWKNHPKELLTWTTVTTLISWFGGQYFVEKISSWAYKTALSKIFNVKFPAGKSANWWKTISKQAEKSNKLLKYAVRLVNFAKQSRVFGPLARFVANFIRAIPVPHLKALGVAAAVVLVLCVVYAYERSADKYEKEKEEKPEKSTQLSDQPFNFDSGESLLNLHKDLQGDIKNQSKQYNDAMEKLYKEQNEQNKKRNDNITQAYDSETMNFRNISVENKRSNKDLYDVDKESREKHKNVLKRSEEAEKKMWKQGYRQFEKIFRGYEKAAIEVARGVGKIRSGAVKYNFSPGAGGSGGGYSGKLKGFKQDEFTKLIDGISLAKSGCGVMSLSSIVSAIDPNVNPYDIAQEIIDAGALKDGQGIYMQKAIEVIGKKHGFTYQSASFAEAQAALKAGKKVVAGFDKGLMSNNPSGHWVVLDSITSDGKIQVINSAGYRPVPMSEEEYRTQQFDPSRLQAESTAEYYIVSYNNTGGGSQGDAPPVKPGKGAREGTITADIGIQEAGSINCTVHAARDLWIAKLGKVVGLDTVGTTDTWYGNSVALGNKMGDSFNEVGYTGQAGFSGFKSKLQELFGQDAHRPVMLYMTGGAGSNGNHRFNRVGGNHAITILEYLGDGKYRVHDPGHSDTNHSIATAEELYDFSAAGGTQGTTYGNNLYWFDGSNGVSNINWNFTQSSTVSGSNGGAGNLTIGNIDLDLNIDTNLDVDGDGQISDIEKLKKQRAISLAKMQEYGMGFEIKGKLVGGRYVMEADTYNKAAAEAKYNSITDEFRNLIKNYVEQNIADPNTIKHDFSSIIYKIAQTFNIDINDYLRIVSDYNILTNEDTKVAISNLH